MPASNYQHKAEQLTQNLASAQGAIRLEKTTSNLFRNRHPVNQKGLDVKQFTEVTRVDADKQEVEVEGMCSYADLVDNTLPFGVMPCVVPQLKTITIGGAVSGIGIESSSFKYGLPHETVSEMDVLLGHGEIVTCRADNQYSDLFHAIANSYGTLGYVLRLVAKTIPVKPYVALQHIGFDDADSYFAALDQWCDSDVDFVDGSVFSENEHYLTIGRLIDQAPWTSDYTWLEIYYRSIPQREQDYLSIHDYIWRWDTDWFWCSKNLGMQNRLIRRLVGKNRLNSKSYTRVMRWNNRNGITNRLNRLRGRVRESVIQDVDIPIEHAAEFLDFFHREIGIKPVWVCPINHFDRQQSFDFYPLDPDKRYVNFGFWDTIDSSKGFHQGHFNRLVTEKVFALNGIQSLYSSVYMERDVFNARYNGERYQALKEKYDPQRRLKNLYEKVVLQG